MNIANATKAWTGHFIYATYSAARRQHLPCSTRSSYGWTRLRNRQNRSWQGHVSAVTFAEMKLEFDAEAVRQFCQERGIARLELFGSALRDDFDSDSDVDLLASIRPGVKCGLFEWVDWQEGLARIFSRRVDLVSRRAVERSRNPYRKHSILSHTKPIYVEGQRLLA